MCRHRTAIRRIQASCRTQIHPTSVQYFQQAAAIQHAAATQYSSGISEETAIDPDGPGFDRTGGLGNVRLPSSCSLVFTGLTHKSFVSSFILRDDGKLCGRTIDRRGSLCPTSNLHLHSPTTKITGLHWRVWRQTDTTECAVDSDRRYTR